MTTQRDWLPRGKPVCQYGSDCYRKCAIHRAEFAHPPASGDSRAPAVLCASRTHKNTQHATLSRARALFSLGRRPAPFRQATGSPS